MSRRSELHLAVASVQRRAGLLLAVMFTLGACELFDPEFPNLNGRYRATWTRSFVGEGGVGFEAPVCTGTITIHESEDSIFSGSYVIPPGQVCFVESGTITGELRRDGGVTFDAGQLDLEFSGCALVNGSWLFNGAMIEGRLTAVQAVRASCILSDSTSRVGALRTDIVADRR